MRQTSEPTGIARARSDVPVEVMLAMIDGLPAMVGYWDSEQRNVVANRPYLDFFGLSPEAIVGTRIRDVLGEVLYEANRPYIELALAGQEQRFDRDVVAADGRARHTQICYTPHTSDGQVVGFFVLVTDVTELVAAEDRARRISEQYRTLAAAVPDGFVLLFDADLRIVVADGPELLTFGYCSADIEGTTIHEAFPAQLAVELEPRYRAVLAGERAEWERRIGDRVFALRAAPVRDDDGAVFAGTVIAQDVTASRRAHAVQSALHEIATSVARKSSTETIAARIAINLVNIFAADTAAVVQFTGPDSGEIVAMAPVQPESVARTLRFAADDWSASAQVAKTGRPALVNYRHQDEGLIGALRTEGFVAGAAAPIHHNGRLWGTIALGAQSVERLNNDVLVQLTAFAELVEIALSNLEAWSSLNEQAARDPLTHLPNRRSFDDHIAREQEQALRTAAPLSIVAIDVDHFKRINDTFGHPAGDRVLVELAEVLTAVARRSEMVARLGGEEFAWVLPRTGAVAAARAAERARHAIATHQFAQVGQVTISLGVCTSATGTDAADLLASADEALYVAKRSGRNQVRSAPADPTVLDAARTA